MKLLDRMKTKNMRKMSTSHGLKIISNQQRQWWCNKNSSQTCFSKIKIYIKNNKSEARRCWVYSWLDRVFCVCYLFDTWLMLLKDLSQNTFWSKYVNDQPKMIGNTNCKPGCLNSAKSGQCRHTHTHIYIYIQDVTYVFKVACFLSLKH